MLLPLTLPGGVVGCWQRAREPLARWLWQQAPDWQGWVAIDGLAGTAIGSGATRAEAEGACRAAIGWPQPRREVPTPLDQAEVQAKIAAQDADRRRAVVYLQQLRAAARGETVVSLEDRTINPVTGAMKHRRGDTVGHSSGSMNIVFLGPMSPVNWPA